MKTKVIKKYANVFTIHTLQFIGGVETYLYEMGVKYGNIYDITVFYINSPNPEQVKRLKQVLGEDNVIQFKKPYDVVYCDTLFMNYDLFPYVEYFIADKVYDVVHANFYLQHKLKLPLHEKIDSYLAVSDSVRNGFLKRCKEENEKVKIETCYNPITVKPTRKPLLLLSATRLSEEKGLKRMITLANELDKANIPFIWLVFTNDVDKMQNKSVVYMKPRLDIKPFIKMADYTIQLSDSEGYCYTILESLTLNTPVIVTDLDTFREQGVKNGVNGYLLPLDMKTIPLENIVNNIPLFDYTFKKDNYQKYLTKNKIHTEEREMIKIKVIKPFFDIVEKTHFYKIGRPLPMNTEYEKFKYIGEMYEVTDDRAKELARLGLVEIVEKPKTKRANAKRVK